MKVWLDGQLLDEKDAKLSVLDHGALYGDGVFEGIRAYNGKVFQCQAHIDRLYDSAKTIRIAIPYTKQEIVESMYGTLKANGMSEAYIRLVVTRGAGTLGLNPFHCPKPSVFIIVGRIAMYPAETYRDGMAVIIAKTVRNSPRMIPSSVKSLNYLNNILGKIEAIDAGVAEAIMLNEGGEVAECTGENIFVVKNGRVSTPPLDASILPGITRAVVLGLAGKMNIPAAEDRITVEQLYAADECFLSGTAAEIISVTKIDGRMIGGGKPGRMTQHLLQAFREFIRSQRD